MAWWNRKKNTASDTPVDDPQTDPQDNGDEDTDPATGPIRSLPRRSRFPRFRFPRFRLGSKAEPEDLSTLPAFERQRKIVESFQEDALELADRIKLKAAKIASIILPVIAVYAIGGELGQYFAGGTAFSWGASQWVQSQYLIAYAGEFALAVLTYALGHAVAQRESGTAHAVKLTITFVIWFLFLAASAAGQWYVALATLHPTPQMETAIAIRIGMACSLDIASVCLMWWRGKSLAKFLEQQAKKAESIRAVNESELAIQAAQEAAERRRREDEEYLNAKRNHNQMIIKIQELQNAALVRQAEQALIDRTGGSSHDRSNW
jgi:hypothetical protein